MFQTRRTSTIFPGRLSGREPEKQLIAENTKDSRSSQRTSLARSEKSATRTLGVVLLVLLRGSTLGPDWKSSRKFSDALSVFGKRGAKVLENWDQCGVGFRGCACFGAQVPYSIFQSFGH
jgi:hypothetical protein